MRKKYNIDFILEENSLYKIIFRFYPRKSSCHSFDDEPPKSWNDVYKVYYSYRIIKVCKNSKRYVILYDSPCDECSVIDEVGHICLLLADGCETIERADGKVIPLLGETILPFGMGTDWTVLKHVCVTHNYDEEDEIDIYYKFMLFNYSNVGYKFTLTSDRIKDFGNYLLTCCDYMLAHGDPI